MVKCIYDKCDKIPTYNIKESKIAIYYVEHKLPNMVDVIHKTCQYNGCNIRPNYNIKESKIAIYCVEHKLNFYRF